MDTTLTSQRKNSDSLRGIPPDTLLTWYDEMLLIRRFEEKAAQLYGMGKIGGFCHLYNGQEAIAVGALGTLTPEDYVITAYRDHGLAISKGVDPRKIMAELLGKIGGTTKGKGGSMHIFDHEKRFLGGHAIVGGHIPLAAGAAFAIKYRNEKNVCLCFIGDGATNIGTFHESLNLAALWKLPVIYIIENNKYGMGTAVDRASAVDVLQKKAAAYDMRSDSVEGNNVLEVYRVIKEAVEHARTTSEPSLIEIHTFRYRGHSMSDPIHGHYRSKEEVEEQKRLDPITLLAEMLKEDGIVAEDYFDAAEKRIKKIIDGVVEYAETSPEPPAEELWTDVYYTKEGNEDASSQLS